MRHLLSFLGSEISNIPLNCQDRNNFVSFGFKFLFMQINTTTKKSQILLVSISYTTLSQQSHEEN